MLKRAYTKTRRICRVTFELPASTAAKTVHLCGEFNAWNQKNNR